MKNGWDEKRKASVSVARYPRESTRAALQQFRVNECWRAPRHRRRAGEHARVRPGRKGETKRDREKETEREREREREREKGIEQEGEGEKENAQHRAPRAHMRSTDDENGSCSWAKLGAATRPPPRPPWLSSYTILQVRFHGARSCSTFPGPCPGLSPSFVYPLPFSLCRVYPNITSLLPILLSFFLVSTSQVPCTILLHVRWHACTHAHRTGVVRQRGPPDSSPAALQTPNVPTATVDTLPNFSSSVAKRGGEERKGTVKFNCS